ncbi:hypothetical protein QE197_16990 [Arsenophonus nasoniae]|uniref:Uncharacterized protein n=1 Tax=Arsenophonus nasoniae TaxID=638 RepID=A0A4P7L5G6_9GAMM|nr:hypothetical protein [Arsenophonus nasoniae]QBY45258.1 hypothetical protein ArsFIN_38560 [Arsenophonus nasoniae]WGM05434.1 hypothetical protein QE258_18360 [Arsenophonus nasoniae]WGM10444.1 hypothetical protein QE197_16990 [Arsenophonus nasoniae]WGM15155.1 hypothetical protein QE193_16880 [Arsenophonus nasoniae]
MGDRQSVTLKKQTVAGLSAKNFNFQPTFVAPAAYTSSHTTMTQAQTGLGTVILKGGGDGIHFNLDAQGQMKFSLAGTIYSRDSAASDVFVVEAQRGVNDYQNALRGFRHGIDKIDLRQVGISDFSQLTIVKNNRATINGLSQIHGVDVMLKSADGADADVKLLYLDTLDVSQLDANDFLFAKPAPALVSTVKPVVVLSPDKLTVIVQDPLTANTPEVDLTDSARRRRSIELPATFNKPENDFAVQPISLPTDLSSNRYHQLKDSDVEHLVDSMSSFESSEPDSVMLSVAGGQYRLPPVLFANGSSSINIRM